MAYLKRHNRSASLPKNVRVSSRENEQYSMLLKNESEVFPPFDSVQEPPMWPTECQVFDHRISHRYYIPDTPEPFYKSTGKEARIRPFGEKRGRVVYEYVIPNSHSFMKSCSSYACKCGPRVQMTDDSLRFESRFESGNLAKAIRSGPEYYELFLRNDLYTYYQREWFYFKVTNMDKDKTYRFSIVNITRDIRLYSEGMMPLMYSKLKGLCQRIGWTRCGSDIKFFSNEVVEGIDTRRTYTLTFTIQFPFNKDEVYFAYSYPYTYSDLQEYLMDLNNKNIASPFTTIRLLCKSMAGNNVYCVTITNKSKTKKRAVVIIARVRPSETPSSWMMKGLLDYLTSTTAIANHLRDVFIFQLIPMMNPDGVIVGNTSCSLSGKDLSTEFNNSFHQRFPSIWHTKLLVEKMIQRYGVVMFCDLRAQNIKQNIYLYGCDSDDGMHKHTNTRAFPKLLQKYAEDVFSFKSCKYNYQKKHESSSCLVMWMMGIPNSFSIEASYGGSQLGNRAGSHFDVGDYEDIGESFCIALLTFYQENQMLEKSITPKETPLKLPTTPAANKQVCKGAPDNLEDGDYSTRLKLQINSVFPIIALKNFYNECPQWPPECQVIYPKVSHIYYVPNNPEPFYKFTGKEVRPNLMGGRAGKIVYEYRFPGTVLDKEVNFNQQFANAYEYTLKFESRFESGNLAKVIKINNLQYELYVRNDLYSTRQKQWFYFKVTNMKCGLTYRLSIVNLTKKENLYKEGMKPLFYSTKDATSRSIGWRRWGQNICYFCNDGSTVDDGATYTLSFTMEFPHEDDSAYLAYCYPYSYSDLKDYLHALVSNPEKAVYTKLRQLCKTISGNIVYFVTITSPRSRLKAKTDKKAIIVTARVHPAETPASWMMKGFLDFLTGDSNYAQILREKYIFQLIPMLNPDGVIVGNTRYSLSGKDLNGQFKNATPKHFPTVWYTKLLVMRAIENYGVALYCDLHAQYSNHNIFIFGCDKRSGADKFAEVKGLPSLLEKFAPDKFSYQSCKYNNEKTKQGTARMEIWSMGVQNSYTIEASFGGSSLKERANTHFNVEDYEKLGHAFCRTIYENGTKRETKLNTNHAIEDLREENTEYVKLLKKESDDVFPCIHGFNDFPPPRWPSECEVVEGHVKHMQHGLILPEPYYLPASEEKPKPCECSRGKTVYQYPIKKEPCFSTSCCNGKCGQVESSNSVENTLMFESRFESGNLAKAVKLSDDNYELHLRSDLYTDKQRQWFYFRVTQMKKHFMYRFSIVNMSKEENLYKEGMKPLMYSEKYASWNRTGWKRCGDNIEFFQTEGENEKSGLNSNYTLSFNIKFPYDDDVVYLAYSFPYTYTDLHRHLLDICNNSTKSRCTIIRKLCNSLAENTVYYVTITDDYKSEYQSIHQQNYRVKLGKDSCKKSIIITARMHPGETPSSWMMKGFLDFLTGPSKTAKKLREMYVFKLIPMLNPDGVIVGNTRFSLSGDDLNEQFNNPSKKKFPTIWYTKLLIDRDLSRNGVAMFCDLQAQHVMHNTFITSSVGSNISKIIEAKVFPSILEKHAQDKFSFECCKFQNGNFLQPSAYNEMTAKNIPNSIALKTSFCGTLLSSRSLTHYSTEDYEQIGHSFCRALLNYHEEMAKQDLILKQKELETQVKEEIEKSTKSIIRSLAQLKKKESFDYEALITKPSSIIFPIVNDVGIFEQNPMWPAECPVLEEKIKHIYYVPKEPEPYYVHSGIELKPKRRNKFQGKIVYEYPVANFNAFMPDRIKRSGNIVSDTCLPDGDDLVFDSRFESGNLAKAIRINDRFYELYVRNDFYSAKQKQWFYFRISHTKKNITYRFSIVNLTKHEGLWKHGMKPVMYSKLDASAHNIGWRRCGDDIAYYHNDNSDNCGILTFTLDFPHDDDEVFIAYSYPYTYSDLQCYLKELANNRAMADFVTIRTLCKTLAGNNVYYVVITSQDSITDKKTIIITARVHPAETPSSWMMKGFLDFLTSNAATAKELRENFVFKLVPMMNPDGVIVGNTRYSLHGKDLNREFKYGAPQKFPSVWFLKLMIHKTIEKCDVALFCDLHSQYGLNNIFLYGCDRNKLGSKYTQEGSFPWMLEQKAADKFSLRNCKFSDGKYKDGTARVAAWDMGIPHSFTMEASFAGSNLGTRAKTHFSVRDYEQMGHSFCQTMLEYFKKPEYEEEIDK
ncbi:hypothetical protein FQR65_LT00644 [Abscondita terminalis]|nr:hypothetical protein FQR65_LT00644 [Abscondita terminalis]